MTVSPFFVVGVLWLVVLIATVYSSVTIVEEGDLVALLVLGEMCAVLEPGINVTPPFVSRTYPIDATTMTIDRGDERVDVPEEFEADVTAAANR